MKKFTSLHGVGYSTFQRWLSDYKTLTFGAEHQSSDSPQFIDITSALLNEQPRHKIGEKASSPILNQLDVTLPNGIHLMLNTSFEQSLTLIQSLGLIHVPAPTKIMLSTTPIDMRKSYQGLSVLAQDPFSAIAFVFTNKKRDILKILYWHINGFCLVQKRLEKGHFTTAASSISSTLCRELTLYQS